MREEGILITPSVIFLATATIVKLRVENLGPLRGSSELTVRPGSFVLLYGAPATGKSYTMKLVYALSAAARLASMLFGVSRRRVVNAKPLIEDLLAKSLEAVYGRDARRILGDAVFRVEGGGVVLEWLRGEPRLTTEEEKLERYVQRVRERAGFTGFHEYCYRNLPLRLREICDYNVVVLRLAALLEALFEGSLSHRLTSTGIFVSIEPASIYSGHGRTLLAMLYELMARKPASLSGFAATLREEAPFNMLYVPLLLAVEKLADLDKTLAEALAEADDTLAAFARGFMLGGDIEHRIDEDGHGELVYRLHNVELHMPSVSAAVPEAFLLLVAVLHILDVSGGTGRGLVFIEEPETQLHPSLQRLVAWLLLYLAGRGLTILASTHSGVIAVEASIARRASRLGCNVVREILSGLVAMSDNEYCAVAEAVSRARLNIVYFGDGRFREYGEKPPRGVPSITEVLEEQLRAMEVVGAAEEELGGD